MKRIISTLFMLIAFCGFAQHKKAIIVLTYDDALQSQLNIAVPQLDSTHLTGTFFLDGNVNSSNIEKWRTVGKKGNELANHTLYHPCLIKPGDKGNQANNSANYNLYTIMREINMMNTLLTGIDGKPKHTYAYPCTETEVGGVSYLDTLRKSGLVKYARLGGDNNALVIDYSKLDPLQVPSWAVVGKIAGEDLIDFVKKVQKTGGLGVFMFHGVGGDYLTTTAQAHLELLKYLAKHRNEIWITTFQQAMDYITLNKQN